MRHLGLAADDGSPAGICMMNDHCAGFDPDRYRRQMIRVAAVAIAAVEVFDRKVKTPEPALDETMYHMRHFAQKCADEFNETVLLISEPPSAMESDRNLPYVVREKDADARERKAQHEIFHPKGSE